MLILILGLCVFYIATVAGRGPADRLCQNMTLDRFDHVGAHLESVGRWFHV